MKILQKLFSKPDTEINRLPTPPSILFCSREVSDILKSPDEVARIISFLKNTKDYSAIKLKVYSDKEFAKGILAISNIIPLLLETCLLSDSQAQSVCALAVVVSSYDPRNADKLIYITDKVMKCLKVTNPQELLTRAEDIVSEEAKKMKKEISVKSLRDRNTKTTWLLDNGTVYPNKKRTLLFTEAANEIDITRGFMAVLYGLNSEEITTLLNCKNGQDAEKHPSITRKLQQARIELAAGKFPEPAVSGEYRK